MSPGIRGVENVVDGNGNCSHFWLSLSSTHWLCSGQDTQNFSSVESSCAVSMVNVKITWSSVVFFLHDARHPAQLEHLDFVGYPGYHLVSSGNHSGENHEMPWTFLLSPHIDLFPLG